MADTHPQPRRPRFGLVASHQFQVVRAATPGRAAEWILAGGWVLATAASPAVALEVTTQKLGRWFPSGWAWLAVTTDTDGVPTAVAAGAGESVPTDTRHDGASGTGLYFVPVARIRDGVVSQVLTGSLPWSPPPAGPTPLP